jgi:L-iditol 2-dehydrogenase
MRFAATPPYDGTLSTYYVLPEECCFLLPKHVSLREGALIEPLSVAVHVCRLAGDVQGKSIAIFGAGPIGLLCSAVIRAFGASSVVIIDIVDSRLTSAGDYGATSTYKMKQVSPEENAEALLSGPGLPEGVDVVVDATGAEPCIACGVHCLKRGGVFVQAGLGSAKVAVAPICDKEVTFKGSFRYGPGDYELAIRLLSGKPQRAHHT